MGPLLFYLREVVVALSEALVQEIIDREVEGVELVLLEEIGGRRQKTLRLYIDHPGGVTHELCSRVSGAVGRALDEVDPIEGAYTLEVSSPGLERPLRKRSHFEAQVGKKVYVKTRMPVEGSKVWRGILREVGPDGIVVQDAAREARIPLVEIGSAHLIYEFKQGEGDE
jgi:ribosome maturation factor RimP